MCVGVYKIYVYMLFIFCRISKQMRALTNENFKESKAGHENQVIGDENVEREI